MNHHDASRKATQAKRWALRLSAQVWKVLAAHPEADPDNVRHTLIRLEPPPLERLQRILIRAENLPDPGACFTVRLKMVSARATDPSN